jgi:hypothetical protein
MIGILFLLSLVVLGVVDALHPAESSAQPTAPFAGTDGTANATPGEEIERAGGTKKL